MASTSSFSLNTPWYDDEQEYEGQEDENISNMEVDFEHTENDSQRQNTIPSVIHIPILDCIYK